jgi:hypothetical protein
MIFSDTYSRSFGLGLYLLVLAYFLNLGNNFNPALSLQYNGDGNPHNTKIAPLPGVLLANNIAQILIWYLLAVAPNMTKIKL